MEPLAFASGGDSILLIEGAVLATHSPITLGSFLAKCQAQKVRVYALTNDIELRGIQNKYADIQPVDYPAYVELVVAHDKQVAW